MHTSPGTTPSADGYPTLDWMIFRLSSQCSICTFAPHFVPSQEAPAYTAPHSALPIDTVCSNSSSTIAVMAGPCSSRPRRYQLSLMPSLSKLSCGNGDMRRSRCGEGTSPAYMSCRHGLGRTTHRAIGKRSNRTSVHGKTV